MMDRTSAPRGALLVVGATGLAGQGFLRAALKTPGVTELRLLTRRPIPAPDPRVKVLAIGEFTESALASVDLGGLGACCHLAGVLPVGMGEQTYRSLTVDLTLRVARAYASANPGGRFLYVSGLGADASSWLMPLRVKGQAEAALGGLDLEVCHLRPAVLKPEAGDASPHALRNLAYQMGAPFLSLGAMMLPSLITTTGTLGRAMLQTALASAPMPRVLEQADINRLGAQAST